MPSEGECVTVRPRISARTGSRVTRTTVERQYGLSHDQKPVLDRQVDSEIGCVGRGSRRALDDLARYLCSLFRSAVAAPVVCGRTGIHGVGVGGGQAVFVSHISSGPVGFAPSTVFGGVFAQLFHYHLKK